MSLFVLFGQSQRDTPDKPEYNKEKEKTTRREKMKKLAILSPLVILMASTSLAQDSCIVRPSCADMGYTKTEADCSGKITLKCPFDLTKVSCEDDQENNTEDNDFSNNIADFFSLENIITDQADNLLPLVGITHNSNNTSTGFYMTTYPFCTISSMSDINFHSASPRCYKKDDILSFYYASDQTISIIPVDNKLKPQEECEDGDYYYEDSTCSGFKFSSKTPIGIVVDSDKHLVAGLAVLDQGHFWGFNEDNGNMENIPDVTDVAAGQTDIDFNGKENTNAIVSAYPNGEDFYANICSSLTLGGKEWYLPAEGELRTICNKNLNVIHAINFEYFNCVIDEETGSCSGNYSQYDLVTSTEVANSTSNHYIIQIKPGDGFKILCTTGQSNKLQQDKYAICMFKY